MMNQSFPVFFQLPMLIELQMNFPASAEECSLKKKVKEKKGSCAFPCLHTFNV